MRSRSEEEEEEMEVKKESSVNGGGDSQSGDHWAFLEEIDAPMWVDLVVESMTVDQDINASWFEVVHPFHQLSSQHFLDESKVVSDADLLGQSSIALPPSVSRSRGKQYRSKKWKGNNNVLDKQHPIKSLAGKSSSTVSSSYREVKPKIKTSYGNRKHTSSLKRKPLTAGSATDATRPYSLHRKSQPQNPKMTRNLKETSVGEGTSVDSGKQNTYGVKPCHTSSKHTSSSTANFSGNSNSTSSSRHEPIKHKVSFVVDSKTSHTISPDPPKTDSTFGNSESTSILAASSVGSSNSTQVDISDFSKPQPSFRASESPSKPQSYCRNKSDPQDVHTVSDLSHQGMGQTNGLLLALKASLRRSYVTSQPARVEVKDKRQSNGRKSSSGKSSVGSSVNSDINHKTARTVMMNKTKTKQVTDVDQAINHDKPEAKVVTKPCARQLHNRSLNSKRESKIVVRKSISLETSKTKVSHQTENRKVSRLQNIQNLFVDGPKAKQPITNINKGNAIGCSALSEKTARKENDAGSMKWTRKVLKHIGIEGEVVGPKEKPNARNDLKNPNNVSLQGKPNARNDLKNPKNVVQRVYFR